MASRSFFVSVVLSALTLVSGCAGSRKYQDTIAEQRAQIQGLEEESDRLRQEIAHLKERALELETEIEARRAPRVHSDMDRERKRLRAIIERESVEPGAKPGPSLELSPDVERQRSDLEEKMRRGTEKLRRKLEEKGKEKEDE